MIAAVATKPDSYGSALHATAMRLARLAREALVAEAELTPKPGLVDCRGQGCHSDLSLPLMRASAAHLEPFFYRMATACSGSKPGRPLRETLGEIGRQAERSMLKLTGGANTHRGAIWSLGLLVSAAAMESDASNSAESVAARAKELASIPDQTLQAVSHGDIVATRYGVKGARGEARSGFPHVLRCGLPTLHDRRAAGCPETVARLDALLSIMAVLPDTCVLYRGGPAALEALQQSCQAILLAGGSSTPEGNYQLCGLDELVTKLGVSPGGAADLLACTLLLDMIDHGDDHIQPDQSGCAGGVDGAA